MSHLKFEVPPNQTRKLSTPHLVYQKERCRKYYRSVLFERVKFDIAVFMIHQSLIIFI